MGTGQKVALVLEDEPLISIDVEDTLVDAGFAVAVVRTNQEAFDWLEVHTPAVAILDINLPDGPCDGVAELLIRDGVPVVIHSASLREAHDQYPYSEGKWLTKPSVPEDLANLALSLTS